MKENKKALKNDDLNKIIGGYGGMYGEYDAPAYALGIKCKRKLLVRDQYSLISNGKKIPYNLAKKWGKILLERVDGIKQGNLPVASFGKRRPISFTTDIGRKIIEEVKTEMLEEFKNLGYVE